MVCCFFVLNTEDTLEKECLFLSLRAQVQDRRTTSFRFSNIIHLLPLVVLIFPFLYNVPEEKLVQN